MGHQSAEVQEVSLDGQCHPHRGFLPQSACVDIGDSMVVVRVVETLHFLCQNQDYVNAYLVNLE